MSKFLECTTLNGENVLINISKIICVYQNDGDANIVLGFECEEDGFEYAYTVHDYEDTVRRILDKCCQTPKTLNDLQREKAEKQALMKVREQEMTEKEKLYNKLLAKYLKGTLTDKEQETFNNLNL